MAFYVRPVNPPESKQILLNRCEVIANNQICLYQKLGQDGALMIDATCLSIAWESFLFLPGDSFCFASIDY